MKKPNKKTIIIGSSLVGAICLIGGSFAYFSAQDTDAPKDTKIGTVTIDKVDINIGTPENKEGTVNTDAEKDENGNLIKLNPGDIIPVDFKITNTGSKSIEEKTYVYIIFNNNGSADYGKYSNFKECVSILDETGKEITTTKGTYTDKDDKGNILGTYEALRFAVEPGILNGNPSKGNAETQEDTNGDTQDKDGNPIEGQYQKTHAFKIKFKLGANVHTMNQSLEVRTLTQAIQYRNTNSTDVDKLLEEAEKEVFVADSTTTPETSLETH